MRPRVVGAPVIKPATQNPPKPATVPRTTTAAAEAPQKLAPGPIQYLTPLVIQARISEAKRMPRTRPMATAMTTPSIQFVTVAALDRQTPKTHFITLSKETFLTKSVELATVTSLGTNVNLKVIRANGVNTALTITTPEGSSLAPLTVEYPIEKAACFARWLTTRQPIPNCSNDLVRSGQSYVRNMLDLAVKRLSEKGVTISPDLVDVAETTLRRGTRRSRPLSQRESDCALRRDPFIVCAERTRYVSLRSGFPVGASGMVQQIPWAYNLQRTRCIRESA